MKKSLIKVATAILTASLMLAVFSVYSPAVYEFVRAEASANVESTNPWGDGGQITLNLSGCSGYGQIEVVVDFGGTVSSASGWGFDSYVISGSQVTATVSASGPNSWGFDGNVGIQVTGSNINNISLVSVTGSGTGSTPSQTSETQSSEQQSSDGEEPASSDYSSIEFVQGDDWLTTDGDRIVDQNGTEVWLTGCNWFGYNTGSNLFDGVWACNMREALESIADHGFNLLRIPMSAELLLQWSNGEYPEANYNHAYNPELESMNSLEIFDYALDILAANGVKVMIDIHSLPTDAMGHNLPLWYTDSMTVDDFYEALDWLSARYANNDTIIAYDLKNEPHGKASEPDHAIWNDSEDANNWRYVAQTAGNIILDNNPHALIVIEGIQIYPIDPVANNFTSTNDDDYYNSWWGGNLRAVADYPIDFGSPERNAQVVYSPHDYGPAVYAQPWFEGGFTYESLYEDYWHDAWLYIDEEQIAPLLIGEWGGFMSGDNLTWMTYMRQLIADYHLNHTFWCFNANSGDTGGLVLDDFVTWDTEKYNFVREVLWQDADGNFIGLDHVIALGDNGICLSDFSGLEAVPVVNPGASVSSDGAVTTGDTGSGAVVEGTGETIISGDTVTGTLGNALKIVIGAAVALVLVAGGFAVYTLGKKTVRKD
ncbi:MAG: glycoside hydrolase family 5 protein [Clostridiales bacterium]|nr:glycoside hydrolase family 5 protein [Clostridiales bacterium]MBP3811218.1 glycoside hydrolase family 5 protein [Clostridiales bacterium]